MGLRPAAEVTVSQALVGELLREQFPHLADLQVRPAPDHGWDNTVFRLGENLTVRLPRRKVAVAALRTEIRWLPEIAERLPLPVPIPVEAGQPGAGYPWPWSVCRWLPGEPVGTADLADPIAAATALAGFLDALHTPAAGTAPRNPVRGVPLRDRLAAFTAAESLLDRERKHPSASAALQVIRSACAAPGYRGDPVWLHGDFHPANILHSGGHISGVLDFGDLCAGDPAVDYAVAWMMFDPDHREPLRASADRHGPGTWRRAQGWAAGLGLVLAAHSADSPMLADVAERTIGHSVA